jgi:hypothetical protein
MRRAKSIEEPNLGRLTSQAPERLVRWSRRQTSLCSAGCGPLAPEPAWTTVTGPSFRVRALRVDPSVPAASARAIPVEHALDG